MAKLKISDYSSTSAGANLNTDINSIDIDEGCAPSGINNAIRTLMAQVKDFQTGVSGDGLTLGGALSGTSATLSGDLTVDTNTLYVDSTNNTVGIGTTSPTQAGLVINNIGTNTSTSARIALKSNETSADTYMRFGRFGTSDDASMSIGNNYNRDAGFSADYSSYGVTNIVFGDGELSFGTDAAGATNPTTRMTIDSSGNVGIGISSISRGELQINAASGAAELHMTNTGTGTGSTDGFTLFMTEDGDGAGVWLREAEPLRFATAASERMRIDSTGDVGIGTTSPVYKFDIYENTTTYTARIFNDGNDATRRGLIIRCGSDTGAGTNVPVTFQDGDGTTLGSITFTGGTITYGTFTAWHPCVLPEGVTEYPYGTLLEIVSTYSYEKEGADYKQAIRYNVQKTQAENSKAVLGVYAGSLKDIFEDEPNLHQAYVLGDGHILCNNSGGDIKIGDGICSSSVAGIGKKATINPSMIIGIAQENVTFANSEETKLVAVQYGLQQFTPWVD